MVIQINTAAQAIIQVATVISVKLAFHYTCALPIKLSVQQIYHSTYKRNHLLRSLTVLLTYQYQNTLKSKGWKYPILKK